MSMTAAPAIKKTGLWRSYGAWALYALAALLLAPFYRYELAPDSIAYISIAQQYAAGYFKEAISAYWSPLYSWLLTALLLIHLPVWVAAKLVGIGCGLAALYGLQLLARGLSRNGLITRALLTSGALLILAYTLEAPGADLLFAALLLIYLGIVLDPAYPAQRWVGFVCGALGGLAYLSKSYAIAFFPSHFVLMSIWRWASTRDTTARREIVRQFLAGVLVFALICLVWMGVLHAKFGRWMPGSSAGFNHRLVGPESSGYPQLNHLLAPSSEHAISAWQEPSLDWLPDWKLLANGATLKHEAKLLATNSKAIRDYLLGTTPLAAGILLAFITLAADSRRRAIEWLPLLLTAALFCAGYALVTVEDRYLWFVNLLLLLMAALVVERVFEGNALSRPARWVLGGALLLSFLISPLRDLAAHFEHQRTLYQLSKSERPNSASGKLASCGHWGESSYLAFAWGLPYWGVTARTPDADGTAQMLNPDFHAQLAAPPSWSETAETLAKSGITYYLVWPDCQTRPPQNAAGTERRTAVFGLHKLPISP